MVLGIGTGSEGKEGDYYSETCIFLGSDSQFVSCKFTITIRDGRRLVSLDKL